MNEDNSLRQYVAKCISPSSILAKIAVLTIATILLIVIAGTPSLNSYLLVFAIGITFTASALMRNFSVEYEYLLTDSTFFVDSVFGVSKRKNELSVELSKISGYISCNDKEYEKFISRAKRVLEYSSSKNSPHRVCFFSEEDSLAFVIEPSKELLNALCCGTGNAD